LSASQTQIAYLPIAITNEIRYNKNRKMNTVVAVTKCFRARAATITQVVLECFKSNGLKHFSFGGGKEEEETRCIFWQTEG
jgi:hypothetical protein